MNNCYECPHRKEVVGSAHSSCHHPMLGSDANHFNIAINIQSGLVSEMSNKDGVALEFDKVGVQGGWCLFPLNFDPIWVKCNLPI